MLQGKTIRLNGTEYYGDYQLISDQTLFYEKNWDYGPGESFPMKVKINADSQYTIRKTLFRESDFIEEYRKYNSKPNYSHLYDTSALISLDTSLEK